MQSNPPQGGAEPQHSLSETTMAYLERFEPPELLAGASTLRNQLENSMVFHARQIPTSPSTTRLLMTYLITTDKAAREYNSGCRRVRDHMDANGGIQEFVEGAGHFENCINATKRALRAFQKLGKSKAKSDRLTIDRVIRKLATSFDRKISCIRNSIEHIDDDIFSDAGIPEGLPHLLTIDRKGENLEIGTHRMPIVDLRFAICALHDAGTAIINSMPTPADT